MKIALIDNEQNIIQVFSGGPEVAVRFDLPDGTQISPVILGWSNKDYSVIEYIEPDPEPIPEEIPDRVTSRQFKFRLLDMGLYEIVEGWVNSQDKRTQIGFETSSTFYKEDEMIQTGFKALGFTSEEVDNFFIEAGKI